MIYFVGAGSGAPDLITVRGQRLLEEADLIIYAGSLVNPELLKNAKPEAQIYNSAKLHLDEVISLMKAAEAEGKQTVRLHTGDPSIYGAIREQMERLDELGFDYEVCPGVSSFCGAAAALKAEFTVPSVSQTVIITRMEGRTPVPELEKLHLLASHQASMVIFLSAGLSEKVQEELLKGGYPEDTPCGIVYKATWPEEKVFYSPLKDLHQTMQEEGVQNFALITVGNFLGDKYELSKLYDRHFTTAFRKGEAKE